MLPIVFAGGLIAAIIVLLVLEVYNSKRVSKLTEPVYEFAMKRAEDEAARIIAAARSEARQLMEKAEKESLDLVAAHKAEDEGAEKAYQSSIQSLEGQLRENLQAQAQSALETEQKLSEALATEIAAAGEQSRADLSKRFETIDKEAARLIDERVAEAFAAAKRDAEAYEHARKEAVDAQIFSLIGETMKILLQKNLPPEVHAEVVQAALEEAKANKVF
jgi:hypothetical protein